MIALHPLVNGYRQQVELATVGFVKSATHAAFLLLAQKRSISIFDVNSITYFEFYCTCSATKLLESVFKPHRSEGGAVIVVNRLFFVVFMGGIREKTE